jgi:hypothetical protein
MIIMLKGSDKMVRQYRVSDAGSNMFSSASLKSTGAAPETDCKWNTMLGTVVLAVALLILKHWKGGILTIGKLN